MTSPVALHTPVQPSTGWQASLELKLQHISGKTCLLPQRRFGPLTVQRPFYPEDNICHVYILHPPGGVVGGDSLSLSVEVASGAHGLLTTPGASKFYRSRQATAHLDQQLQVHAGAALEFLPLESIYYPAAELASRITVNLSETASFAGWEVHCFGLPANDKDFTSGKILLNTELRVEGRLLLHDRLNINSDEQKRHSGLRGNRVYGSFVIYSQHIRDDLLSLLQAVQPESGLAGVSRVEAPLLVARYLGDSTEHAHKYFRRLWAILRPSAMGTDACQPRIWST